MNRSRNSKSSVEAKRLGRSRRVSEFQILIRKDTKAQRKRSSITKVVARSQLHRHQCRLSLAGSALLLWDRTLLRRFGIILKKILDRHELSGITVQWNGGFKPWNTSTTSTLQGIS